MFISSLEDLSDLAVLKGLELKGASVEHLSEEIWLNKRTMIELHKVSAFLEEVQMSTIAASNTTKLQLSWLTLNVERQRLRILPKITNIHVSDDIGSEELLTESKSDDENFNENGSFIDSISKDVSSDY